MIELMKLPFKESALAPYVSEETVQFHYGKHHKAYVDKVNELISGTEFQDTPLEEIIERTFDKPEYQVLYNNAGQVFNHNVYWNSIGIGEKFDADMQERIAERLKRAMHCGKSWQTRRLSFSAAAGCGWPRAKAGNLTF